jgi:hypothetical protein
MNFSDYDLLAKGVDTFSGLIVVQMKQLRSLSGKKRLGSDVRKDITDQLRQRMLKFHPDPLPEGQDSCVLIYREQTDGGNMVAYVLEPQQLSIVLPVYVQGFKQIKEAPKSRPG